MIKEEWHGNSHRIPGCQSESGYVWTGEFDLNMLRVDVRILESAEKKLQSGLKNIWVCVDRA